MLPNIVTLSLDYQERTPLQVIIQDYLKIGCSLYCACVYNLGTCDQSVLITEELLMSMSITPR